MYIVEEAAGFMQVYSDGMVKRSAPEIVTSAMEPRNGYKFKDVIIDERTAITGRLFIPAPEPEGSSICVGRLPVLVYFHGGGFCIGSTTWLGYHHFLGDLCVTSRVIILSVDYRLAPEYRLPVAYDDCYSSLEWLSTQVNSDEPWLRSADLSWVFLSGDSAGANIAHQVAIRTMRNENPRFEIQIKGLLLIHPYFGSEKRTNKEMENTAAGDVSSNDMFWRLSIPKGSNRDYFGCNYEMQDVSLSEWSAFPAVVVYVAGSDFLKERGETYVEFLMNKGVKEVSIVEAKEEVHVFHVFYPESDATHVLQQQMTEFMLSIMIKQVK